MKYYCELCDYTTTNRDRIHYHHIIPKSSGGHNKSSNRLYCCPNCHSKIYVPIIGKGIHGIEGYEPIIILGKVLSTDGRLVNYLRGDVELYSKLKNIYKGDDDITHLY